MTPEHGREILIAKKARYAQDHCVYVCEAVCDALR